MPFTERLGTGEVLLRGRVTSVVFDEERSPLVRILLYEDDHSFTVVWPHDGDEIEPVPKPGEFVHLVIWPDDVTGRDGSPGGSSDRS